MKHQKTVSVSATFGAFFLACLCLCSSPLSDVDITDFGLIGASISISKSFKADALPVQTVRARIYDKNFATVQIKDGGVSANGTTMPYRSGPLYDCYEMGDAAIAANTFSKFVITLSNGDTCTSMLQTPPAEFGTVTIPAEIKINGGATVTWSEVTAGSPVGVRITLDSHPDNIIFEIKSMADSGKIIIPPFADTSWVGPATITLTRSRSGAVSGKLRNGSAIAAYSFTDSTEIVR